MTIEVHLTPAARARVSPHGWRQLPSGKWVTFEPLVDTGNAPHYAHLHRKALREVAARIGARMLAPSTVIELNRHGRRLKPVTLTPDSKMSSKARCDEHDVKVRAQIDAAPDDDRPVSGGGKPYIDDTEIAPRQATIFGWATRPDSSSLSPEAYDEWLQPLQNAHANDLHSDYSSIHQLEADSDIGLEDDDEDTDPLPDLSGARDIARGAGKIVQRIGAWLFGPDLTPAHGARCSVAELVQDAKALGTWRAKGAGYVPKIGDLIISARGGQDPMTGGSGHVERICDATIIIAPETIGGNEGNTWVRAVYDMADPALRGFIECGALGAAAVEIALAEKASGVREVAGPKHHPRIQFYHACTRRGGSPLAGMPGHEKEGAATLGDNAPDETPWCASSASWCALQVLNGADVDRDIKPENVSDDALFIPDSLTVATPAAVFEALRKAWPAVIGGAEPKRESLIVLLAQWGIENADGASLHSWNLGNVKRVQGKTWTMRKGVWEMIDGKRETFEPPHPQTHFRAFASLEEGAVEYLRILSTRFAKSWPAVLSGDPAAFSRSLKLQRYYSASEADYTAALVARFAQFARAIPGSPYNPPAPVNLDTRLGQTVALMSLGYTANVDFAGAVKSFQRASIIPLVADGLWGPRTRAAVLAALKARDG